MITIIRQSQRRRNEPTRQRVIVLSDNWNAPGRSSVWQPPTDVIELQDEFLIRVEVAGMNEQDFTLTLDQHTLTVQGVRRDASGSKGYHRMEINFGDFYIEVPLPIAVQNADVWAAYEKGFLLVHLPKATETRISITPQESEDQ